jgi:hypothetical protein
MRDSAVRLEHETTAVVRTGIDAPIRSAAVVATRGERDEPAAGVDVTYRVLQGELTLASHGGSEVTATTDGSGRATVELRMSSHGTAVVSARG